MKDFCLTTDATTLDHNIDNVIQQIDMLFDTDPNEVLGDSYYGSDYRKFLFDPLISNTTIENYARNNIISNCELFDYSLDVKCDIFLGTQNDIILLTVTLRNGSEQYEKIYNIQ